MIDKEKIEKKAEEIAREEYPNDDFRQQIIKIVFENEELKLDKEYLDKVNNEQTEVVLKLNEQVEKMKNCFNCKNNSSKTSVFCRFYARCKNNEYWQQAEKK